MASSRKRSAPKNKPKNGASAAATPAPAAQPANTPASTKKVRPLDDRIEAARAQLRRLEEQKFRKDMDKLAKDNPECKRLARDLGTLRKTKIILADWGHEDFLDTIDGVYAQINDSLMATVKMLTSGDATDDDVTTTATPEVPEPESLGDDEDLFL